MVTYSINSLYLSFLQKSLENVILMIKIAKKNGCDTLSNIEIQNIIIQCFLQYKPILNNFSKEIWKILIENANKNTLELIIDDIPKQYLKYINNKYILPLSSITKGTDKLIILVSFIKDYIKNLY